MLDHPTCNVKMALYQGNQTYDKSYIFWSELSMGLGVWEWDGMITNLKEIFLV